MREGKTSILLFSLFLVWGACDLPTKNPDFSFTADVQAPLIFDKSFVFLGPDGSALDALIDTTKTSFDSLFTVSSRSEEIFIVQEIDAFDVGDIGQAIDPVNADPVDLGVSIGELATPSFAGTIAQQIGVYESDAASAPPIPPAVEGSSAYYPAEAGGLFAPPDNDFVDLSGSTMTGYVFTAESGTVNTLTFTVSNNYSEVLTDGSFAPGSIPDLVVETASGVEIARQSFDRAPAPGQTAIATVDLAGSTLPAGARFRLDVGTPSGFQPIADDPTIIGIAAASTLIRYDGVVLSSLPAQTDIGDSNSEFTAAGELDFVGLVTSSGSIEITIDNNLPVPIVIDDIRLSNVDAFDTYSAGHTFAMTSGQSIAARSSLVIPISLGSTGISRTIRATIFASSPGSTGSVTLLSQDGITLTIQADTEIDRAYFRPNGEEFSTAGNVQVAFDEIQLSDPGDYIEIASGLLQISDLINNLDVSMDLVEITFPQIRTAPYGSSDSLRIRFQGGVDNPASHIFKALSRNAAPRNIDIDLSSVRLYSVAGALDYNLHARAEESSQVRVLASGDDISSTITAQQIQVGAIQATIDPLTIHVTDDSNSDGLLDVLQPEESIETSLSAVNDLAAFGFSSLSLAGSELTFELSTNVEADYVLYAAIAGLDSEGAVTYLGGRGNMEVLPSDTLVGTFVANGAPLSASDLIRIDISSVEAAQSTVVLSDANSSVDDFINSLPGSVRIAGIVILQPGGGPVSIQLPVDLDIGLGASIPLRFRGDATFAKTVSADLSGLNNLADDESSVSLDAAIIRLSYENEIPLGLDARIRIVDGNGAPTVTIPALTEPSMTIAASETTEFGTASTASSGVSEIAIDRATLLQMAQGADIELLLNVSAGQQGVRRVRASDQIKVDMSGEFDLKVSTGN
ncbi:MAG: hypothetical protein HKN43_04170 [Rhodothermales bacterium]|nr:hypothetical protein [Rhodothermales bacterium]